MDKKIEETLVNAQMVMKTLQGMVISLQERTAILEEENRHLREALQEKEEKREADGRLAASDLDTRLGIYYHDLCHYNEKNLSSEDGERLYQTLRYVFDELRRWGMHW